MERTPYGHHAMTLGGSVDLGMGLDGEIGMVGVGLHDAPFPTIAPPPPAPPQSHHHHHHQHHHQHLPHPQPQQQARHHAPPHHPHLHGGLGLPNPQHLHHRGPDSLHLPDPLSGPHPSKQQADLGGGLLDDGPRLVYKNPTNRYQLFVNAWVSNYEQDKSFSERIKSAEAIWRTASGRFCTSKHRPSRPCGECMQAQQEVDQVLNASNGLAIKQPHASEAVAAASRKRVASEAAANAAKKVRTSTPSAAPVIQEGVVSSGIATACGGIESALILFGRRNLLFNSKFAADALLTMTLDSNQGSILLSFIQLVNLYQHALSCAAQEFASVGINDKKLESIEESLNKLSSSLIQAGHIYEDFVRLHITSESNPALNELRDKYMDMFETAQLRTYSLVKSMKSSFKSSVKKVVTLSLSSEGSMFITGRNIQSWDHANQYIINYCSEADSELCHVLTHDQLVQAQSLIRSFGIITVSRLMHLLGAPSLTKGSHPRIYDPTSVREVGHILLDLFPIFIVRDNAREELHIIDQYRITQDTEKRNSFVGILLGGSPRLTSAIEQFINELRSIGNSMEDTSKSFLDFPGNDILAPDRIHSDSNLFSVFCFIINRFGSAFAKCGMNNDVCELQQRWFDGELSISEVAVSCLQAKGVELSVSVSKLNIDSYHASTQVRLLQDLSYHIGEEISVWSADDFPFPLPCSGDVSAFSSTSVSFPDDELQYVTVSGYTLLQPLEAGTHTLSDLKVFPKALSLHSCPSLGIDAQFHANEFRTILERIQQSGNQVKPIQIIFSGSGVGWSPQSQVVAFFLGRVWRDLGLHALVVASYAAGYSDMNIIQERIWGKMNNNLRALLGISSVHNTVNTVLTNLEDVWNSTEKLQGATLEHLEADSYWYQDIISIHNFFSHWNLRKDGEDDEDMDPQTNSHLAEEWRFLVKHMDRRFNMVCFKRCNDDEQCDHCNALGHITAPNVWKIFSQNEGRFFSPGWSISSLKQNYAFRPFIEEIDAVRHERPDFVLPSRHGESEKLRCRDCYYLANTASQLARHYELLHPEIQSDAFVICRYIDPAGKTCGLPFESRVSLENHKKELNHIIIPGSVKRGRPRKKSLDGSV